ncbi:MAG: MTH1187 family thiamine-binding protein [Nitrosarchaeum sp.]
MIHAEISVYPIGTGVTSVSFYIAKGIEAIQNIKEIKYEINSMGTILESDNIDKIYDAAKTIMEVVHNLGVNRVEVILKIDSRKDKQVKMEDKINSIKKHLSKN